MNSIVETHTLFAGTSSIYFLSIVQYSAPPTVEHWRGNVKKKINADYARTKRISITARRALHCTSALQFTKHAHTDAHERRRSAVDLDATRTGGEPRNNSNNNNNINTVQRQPHVQNVTHQTTAEWLTIKLAVARMRAPGETRFATVAPYHGQARQRRRNTLRRGTCYDVWYDTTATTATARSSRTQRKDRQESRHRTVARRVGGWSSSTLIIFIIIITSIAVDFSRYYNVPPQPCVIISTRFNNNI